MTPARNIALTTGVLFIITFVASIPALLLYDPVLHDPNYVVGAGADARVFWGALLEVITAIANIGSALALYPILRRQFEALSIGYIAARIVESTLIVIGLLSLLTIVSLRQGFAGAAGADTASLLIAGKSLVALHDWTFLWGPGFTVGIGNGLMLGFMMYRSGLVPRGMAVLGLVGGPLILISGVAVLFGLYPQVSVPSFIATIPEILWEASLGIWLTVKGFSPAPVLSGYRPPAVGAALSPA